MPVKKSELYSSLWQSCDELRGSMDASQYKDYVLVLLFVKYVSDKYAGRKYGALTVPQGSSFADMIALKGTKNIGDDINKKILGPLERANEGLSFGGIDFNDPAKLGDAKEMVPRLTSLIAIFENPALDFSKNRADGDDILGDAYEYLMRHFATESGKSKGQFYTPSEVSRVVARLLGIRHAKVTNATTIYDPTCGSGSLLLKVGEEAAHGADPTVKVTLCGQEKDGTTAGLARMNMILHDCPTAEIKQGNTLANPLFTLDDALQTFDYVVANPPFSDKRWSTGLHPDEGGAQPAAGTHTAPNYGRFAGYGVPPAKQGDYAYLLHILRSLKPTGRAACILPHGVLFRGHAEAAIRKNLVTRGYLRAIIGLPANLFYGTGIPACILVLDKDNAQARKGVFMIDASAGYRKDGNKNRLREQDIHKIIDTYERQLPIPGYSRLVPVAEIADPKNGYNLNLPRYLDSGTREDRQDIAAHLHGGIPERDLDALGDYWKVLPSLRAELVLPLRPDYVQLRVEAPEIKPVILGHPEFTAFQQSAQKRFAKWRRTHLPALQGIGPATRPKTLIETLSEDLLAAFAHASLLDPYDVYQRLMDYWAETMQDDVYLIVADGWTAPVRPRLVVEDKKAKLKIRADLVAGRRKYQVELVPPALLIARYFVKEQAIVEQLSAEVHGLQQQLDELDEENGGDEGLFAAATNEKGRLTQASLKARLKELDAEEAATGTADEEGAPTERSVLLRWADLNERQLTAGGKLLDAKEALADAVLARYGTLTEDEVKTLVVEDKWLAALAAAVQTEIDHASQRLKYAVADQVKLRGTIRQAANETIDLKVFEADMRHLIDTYIEAKEPKKISHFDNLPLLELIVKSGIADAINQLPDGVRNNPSSVSEIIANNIRSKIIKERLTDPAYYDRMSALLDEILADLRARRIEYAAALKRYAALAKDVQSGKDAGTPRQLDTPGKRALYNILIKNPPACLEEPPIREGTLEEITLRLALDIDKTVRRVRHASWRGNRARENVIKEALAPLLGSNDDEIERVFLIIHAHKGDY